MTFDEARQKLAAIAGPDRAYSLEYHLLQHTPAASSVVDVEVRLYIDTGISVYAPTWAQAFEKLDHAINKPPVDPEEMPGEELQSCADGAKL